MNFHNWSKNDLRTWVRMMEKMPFFNNEEDKRNIEKEKEIIKNR